MNEKTKKTYTLCLEIVEGTSWTGMPLYDDLTIDVDFTFLRYPAQDQQQTPARPDLFGYWNLKQQKVSWKNYFLTPFHLLRPDRQSGRTKRAVSSGLTTKHLPCPLLPPCYPLATEEHLRRGKVALQEPTFAPSPSLHVQTPGGNTCRLPRLQTLNLRYLN